MDRDTDQSPRGGVTRRRVLGIGTLALLGGGVLVVQTRFSRAQEAGVMTPPEALEAAAKGDILLVDVRRPDEWQATGLPQNAVGIDMRRSDFVSAVLVARRHAQQPVAVICARGVRSARVTQLFEAEGVSPIIDVPEGMLGSRAGPGWLKRGLPVDRP